MTRLSETEGRQKWEAAVRVRGWQNSKLRLAMFDYQPDRDGPTRYSPAPAWPTIADGNNTVHEADYDRLERALLAQGEPYSRRGAAAHSGQVARELVADPLPVSRDQVVATIRAVMGKVHPLAVTQEQILRAAFFAQLPRELAESISTAKAAVHPERPTPSSDYIFTGTRGVGMRARYDLGFGHPTESSAIAGVAELKAGRGTFDRLKSSFYEPDDITGGEPDLAPEECKKLKEPLKLDLLKLLDPLLPMAGFRISWIASGKRGSSTSEEIKDRAVRIVEHVASKRKLAGGDYRVDLQTGWLICTWQGGQVHLELAWYQPTDADPGKFEVVFPPL